MEDLPPYGDEDPWEDDWDWDWAEEPQVTYRDAIERLRSLIQGRTDVRIDWNGQRGLPRDDVDGPPAGSADDSGQAIPAR